MITIESILRSNGAYDIDKWNINDIIKENKSKVFVYEYPILEEFKDDFEYHVCRHFYKEAIAPQNIGEFCYYLNSSLCDIFPYYNNILSQIGDFDALRHNGPRTEHLVITHDEDTTDKGASNSKDVGNSDTLTKGRDFPNSAITQNQSLYYTDSDETTSSATNTNDSSYDDKGTKDYTQIHDREVHDDTNINYLKFMKEYRDEIDEVYHYIYRRLQQNFISIY